MATNNSSNQSYANNADGYSLAGGTTPRTLTLTGGNVTITGDGSGNTYTFPSSSDTLAGLAASQTILNKQLVLNHTAQLATGGITATFEQFGTTAGTGASVLGMFNTTAGTQAEFQFYRSKNASIGSATVVASGDGLGKITWYGAQQTGTFATQTNAAQIRAEVDGTVTSGGSGDMPGRIVFATTPDGSGTLTDRLILDSAGVLKPNANDGIALGTASLSYSDLFLASGAVINIANSNWVATHTSGILTVGTGDLRVTTAGTNTASCVTVGGTQTLTNKRITPRVQSVTSSATVTPDADANDEVVITAQAAGLTLANPSGTPTQGQAMTIRIKDNGTARSITFGSQYRAIGVTLPTTTVISKTMYITMISNTTDTKWDVLAVGQEA